MYPLKPLPLDGRGWPVFVRPVGVSSRGVDARPRADAANWGLFRYGSATRRSTASAASPRPLSSRGPAQSTDRTPPAARPDGGNAAGPRSAEGRVCILRRWASSAARIEAMNEAWRNVFTEQGRSASIWSSRWTDLSTFMLNSTSHRTRVRSATCRGPTLVGDSSGRSHSPWAC
jgi:hypothetical protein